MRKLTIERAAMHETGHVFACIEAGLRVEGITSESSSGIHLVTHTALPGARVARFVAGAGRVFERVFYGNEAKPGAAQEDDEKRQRYGVKHIANLERASARLRARRARRVFPDAPAAIEKLATTRSPEEIETAMRRRAERHSKRAAWSFPADERRHEELARENRIAAPYFAKALASRIANMRTVGTIMDGPDVYAVLDLATEKQERESCSHS